MKKQVKKILLVFFIIILLGGAVTIFIVNKNKDSTKVLENFETENETKEENVIIADITKDNENVTGDPNVITEENIVKEETETVVENTNTKQEQIKDNTKTYVSTGGTSENKTQNNSTITNTPTTNNKQEIETSLPNQGTNIDKVEEPAKEEETTEPPKQDVHTYKYNSSIVNKMTNDIKNNESEYMKKYGYNIVVDESIVNLTNQFTYTTNRVKDKIINKFGTIKIYARDYYLNGNYMYTEAYIL